MLDGKVLAAVFATLAAVGTAMSGGAVDAADLQPQNVDSSDSFALDKYLPESFKLLENLREKPEPTNEIQAVITVGGLQSQTISVSKSSLYAQNITSAKIDGKNVDSDEEIVFYKFTGDIIPGKPSYIEGKGGGIITSNVNISGSFQTKQKLETDLIQAEGVERSKISLKDITGEVESNSTSTQVRDSNADLEINSFSGNISVFPANNTVKLSGKVDKLSAGDISFGG